MDTMGNLGCIVYVGLAGKGYSATDAELMLNAARESRCLVELTGLAVFANGLILTLIEGEADHVNNYYKSVTQHIGVGLQNVIKLLDRPIQRRAFGDYCLAFKTYDESLKLLDTFQNDDGLRYFDRFLSKGNVVSKMVKGFIDEQSV